MADLKNLSTDELATLLFAAEDAGPEAYEKLREKYLEVYGLKPDNTSTLEEAYAILDQVL